MPKRLAVASQPLLLQIAGDVGQLRQLVEPLYQSRHPDIEFGCVGVFEHEMVRRAADGRIDGQVLNRLHVERDAIDARNLVLQPANNLARGKIAIIMWLERDQEAAGIERLVGAIDANERA
jgi:hypothetical protein